MDPFRLFANTAYTFLKISQTVAGNVVAEEYEAVGIFKKRDGLDQPDNTELHGTPDATLHVKPDETFVALGLVGNGVRVDGDNYRITGYTAGDDLDTGARVFYKLTLKRESIATWQAADLPLQ